MTRNLILLAYRTRTINVRLDGTNSFVCEFDLEQPSLIYFLTHAFVQLHIWLRVIYYLSFIGLSLLAVYLSY